MALRWMKRSRFAVYEMADDYNLTAHQAWTLNALVDLAQDARACEWTGTMNYLAEATRLDVKTLRLALAALEDAGLIVTKRRSRGRSASTTFYIVCYREIDLMDWKPEIGEISHINPGKSGKSPTFDGNSPTFTSDSVPKTTTDSLESAAVVGEALPAPTSAAHEISDEGMREGWKAVARYHDKGREVTDAWALARHVGRLHDLNPPKPKRSSKPSPKAPERSEGLDDDLEGSWKPPTGPPCPNGVAGCDPTNKVGWTCDACMRTWTPR